jgi:hypothetical protein
MKKICWLIILLLLPQLLKSQNYQQIAITINSPVLYQDSKPVRRIGLEAACLFGHSLNDKLAIETGIALDIYGRLKNTITGYDWVSSTSFSYSNPFLRIDMSIPVLLNFRIAKFEIRNGVNVNLKNFITFKKYAEIDPLISAPGSPPPVRYYDDIGRFAGLSYQGNISYAINDRFSLFLDIKSLICVLYPKSNVRIYTLLGLGLIYKFSHN